MRSGRRFDAEVYAKFEAALSATRVNRSNNILAMLHTVAAANYGLVTLQEAVAVLINLQLTRSSPVNLSGYLIRKMQISGEFERVGYRGSGVYRSLSYVPPVPGFEFTGDAADDGDPTATELHP